MRIMPATGTKKPALGGLDCLCFVQSSGRD
nr:MAG TPA: hypothetical protein [Caudoviricetes sp.]